MNSDALIVCLHGLGRTPSDWDGVRHGLESYGNVAAPEIPRKPTDALACVTQAVAEADVVIGHSMGGVLALRAAASQPKALRALVLTGCFFVPARNGRGFARSFGDYASHRVVFVRSMDRRRPSGGSGRALGSLVRLALTPSAFNETLTAVNAPVLVIHAVDDHHVPIDFARAAAAGRRGWAFQELASGGHHAHVDDPEGWLRAVTPWLTETLASRST